MHGFLAAVRVEGELRPIGTVTFSETDASVYLRPVGARTGTYDYGFVDAPPQIQEWSFETSGQLQAAERPHISIHDSGACHVRTGKDRNRLAAGESIGPLNSYRREHVGTVLTSETATLCSLGDAWPDPGARDEGAEVWEITPPADEAAVRVAVWVGRNSMRPASAAFDYREVRRRRSDGGTLFVLLEALADSESLGDPMVGAIGGWHPGKARDPSEVARFVYVRTTGIPLTP